MKSDKICSFLKDWFGKPDYQFEYAISKDNIINNLLVYLPKPEEGIYNTTFMTAGFSSLDFQIEEHKIECVFELNATLKVEDFKKLGKELVEQFYNCIPFAPNQIHSPIYLDFNTDLKGCLYLNYGKHEPYLWETNPRVRAFEMIPLYQEEITTFYEQPKDIANALIFRANNVDWTNWKRPKANILEEAVSGVWNFIAQWYKDHSARLLPQLETGASKKMIANLNDSIGVTLPEDFVASLRLYNGKVAFHDYQYLSSDQIIETWQMMKKLSSSNAFPSKLPGNRRIEQIRNVWWHENWIPFGKDREGNLMCIDMDPSPSGTIGQIIYWKITEGPIPTQYQSFFHWLFAYERGLYIGYYKIDKEGFIYY